MARIKKAQLGTKTVTKTYSPDRKYVEKSVDVSGFPKKNVTRRTLKGALTGAPRVGMPPKGRKQRDEMEEIKERVKKAAPKPRLSETMKKGGKMVKKAQFGLGRCGPGGCAQTRGMSGYGGGFSSRREGPGLFKRIFKRNK